jgi:hypothetical protein
MAPLEDFDSYIHHKYSIIAPNNNYFDTIIAPNNNYFLTLQSDLMNTGYAILTAKY